jgi:hypothetical protein
MLTVQLNRSNTDMSSNSTLSGNSSDNLNSVMMTNTETLQELLENNKRWARNLRAHHPDLLERLSRSQEPEILWIGMYSKNNTVVFGVEEHLILRSFISLSTLLSLSVPPSFSVCYWIIVITTERVWTERICMEGGNLS